MRWLRRLVYLLRQSRHDADLRDELEAHRSLRAARFERDGLTAADAADASRRSLGNVLLAREESREVWLGSWDTWWQDVRHALRSFRRSPAFTATAAVTLALGIGVNAGIFTVVNAVLFRGLSAPRSEELVSISQSVQGLPDFAANDTFSTAEYVTYRDRAASLSGLAAYSNARGEATLGADSPRKSLGTLVSCNYFAVLQQPPALGRGLAEPDCEPGAELVIVLSDDLWRTAFAADPGIVGRAIQVNRQRATVAGVAAAGTYNGSSFVGGGYFAPINAGGALSSGDSRYQDENSQWLTLLGRRRGEASLEQVRAEVAVIAAQIDRQHSGRDTTLTVERARPNDGLPTDFNRLATGAAAVVMTAFGFILLIACANVANLLLARGASRSHEIGIRVSLGATRPRVVRQLVTESLLISLIGGLAGSAVAAWSVQALVALAIPAMLPPWLPLTVAVDVSPDVRVLAFALVLTSAAGILFGLAPALQVATPDLHVVMKQDSAAAGSGRRGGRLRAALVGVQVALCMVLTIAAGLVLRGLYVTYTIEPGFSYRDVTYVSLESVFDGYSPEEAEARRRRLLAAFEALPGVESVASTDQEPLGDDMAPTLIRLPGEDERQSRVGELNVVSARYFDALDLPIVRGRAFTDEEALRRNRAASPDGAGAQPRPAIVSQTTARNLWPGGDAIGRTLVAQLAGGQLPAITLQVVGVVADAQVNSIGLIDPYYVYVPGESSSVLIESRTDLGTMASAVRGAARATDPTLLLTVLPLEATLGWSRGISGTVTSLFAGLGVLALVLAAVGIYGVVSSAVGGRYREIGVRRALGASTTSVLGLILRQTMRPVLVGAAIGAAAASAMSGVLSGVLFGVSPIDPLGLGGAALVVATVALVAGVIAASPAVRADPSATLRSE
jgi:macrolide transport system ATP-binding/permease protein